jgi:hypothetical protein
MSEMFRPHLQANTSSIRKVKSLQVFPKHGETLDGDMRLMLEQQLKEDHGGTTPDAALTLDSAWKKPEEYHTADKNAVRIIPPKKIHSSKYVLLTPLLPVGCLGNGVCVCVCVCMSECV